MCSILLSPSAVINFTPRLKLVRTLDTPVAVDPKAKYWSKIVIFAPVRGFPLEYCHNGLYGYLMVKNSKNTITRFEIIQGYNKEQDEYCITA